MAGPVIADTRPTWLRPETASVLDSDLVKAIRLLAGLTGLDDPTSQLINLMAPMETGPVGGALGALAKRFRSVSDLPSKLDDVVTQLPENPMPGQRAVNLAKKGGVKDEELRYRLSQVLGAPNAPTTKAALREALAQQPITPQVKTRGGGLRAFRVVPSLHLSGESVAGFPRGQVPHFAVVNAENVPISFHDSAQLAREAIDELPSGSGAATKFAQYQVPGGSNYKETLITLPPKPVPFDEWVSRTQSGRTPDSFNSAALDTLKKRYAENPRIAGDAFNFSHFDEPNILAHTRSNERTLPTGEKGTFLEEVQSDWHQQGKQGGYRGQVSAADFTAHDPRPNSVGETLYEIRRRDGTVVGQYLDNRQGPDEAIRRAMTVGDADAVPDAPFKEHWPDLALKQHLLEAADNPETQWLGFTGGQTQADRYDLSKQVSKVLYDESSHTLTAWDNPGRVIQEGGVTPATLSNYIGKEAAEKLLAQPADEEGARILSGLDLQVGGEGMKAFYDDLLPKRLEKLLKPFGGSVERGAVNYVPSVLPAWIAKLTPEMKQQIQDKGFPLWMAALLAMSQSQRPIQPMPSHDQGDDPLRDWARSIVTDAARHGVGQ